MATGRLLDGEEIVKKLMSKNGVFGVSIVDRDGCTIRSTMDSERAIEYATFVQVITDKARQTVQRLDSQNALKFMRIRTKKHEILIAPDVEYIMLVLQKPDTSSDSPLFI